jgi:hypothetical protein
MKYTVAILCLMVAVLFSLNSYAQNSTANKNSLFTHYPPVINCSAAQLEQLFTAAKGEHVSLALPGNFTIEGPVKSNEVKYSNLQTIVISLPSFNNIVLALSKRKAEDNSVVFTGHLFSNAYTDGYELKRSPDKGYQFIKIETEKILPTCSQ